MTIYLSSMRKRGDPMTEDSGKFCKDCKWVHRSWLWRVLTPIGWIIRESTFDFATCRAPETLSLERQRHRRLNETTNLVTGQVVPPPGPPRALGQRESFYAQYGACGPGAKFFQPKKGLR